MLNAVTHVIFDLDGLLVDSEPIYTDALQVACSHFGSAYNRQWKSLHMGMKHDVAVEMVLRLAGLKDKVTIPEFNVVYDGYLDEHLPDSRLMEGAEKLVRHFHKHNIPMAICTGSGDIDYEQKVRNHNWLTEMIPLSVRTSSDPEVKRGKPDPDCFLVTCSRFSPPPTPSQCLVFEDAPNGARAALAANMQVILVPDTSIVPENDRIGTQVLSSLTEFRPELFGLSPYE